MIAENPKWFGGYSDVTALHTAFNQVCGFETYHCTMPSTEPNPGEFTEKWLKKGIHWYRFRYTLKKAKLRLKSALPEVKNSTINVKTWQNATQTVKWTEE